MGANVVKVDGRFTSAKKEMQHPINAPPRRTLPQWNWILLAM
jgi:hypothetical protein